MLCCTAVHGSSSSPDVQLPVRRHLDLNSSVSRALDQLLPGAVRGLRRDARPRGRLHGLLPHREFSLPDRAGVCYQRAERVHHRPAVADHSRSQATPGRLGRSISGALSDHDHHQEQQQSQVARDDRTENRQQGTEQARHV